MSVSSGNPTAMGKTARWLALGAVAGPILFALAWFVLGFLSPGYTIFETRIAPYSPIAQPVSGLGMGTTAPYMNGAFVLSGLLLIAAVIGVFQTIGGSGRPVVRWTCVARSRFREWASWMPAFSTLSIRCPTCLASCWPQALPSSAS